METNQNENQSSENQSSENVSQIEDLQRQLEAVNNKNQELLGKLSSAKSVTEELNQLGGIESIKEIISQQQNKSVESVIEQKDSYIKDLESKINSFTQSQVDSKVDETIRSALAEHGLDSKFELLSPHFKSRVRGELVEGQVRINVLQPDGSPLLQDGRDASVKDLINEMSKKESFSDIFNRKVTGTGTKTTSGQEYTDPAQNPWTREGKNIAKQLELYASNPQKAQRLMKEAGVLK